MPGRYSWELLVLVHRPVLQILTLVQTKKMSFSTRELEPLVSCPPSFLELASKKLSHYYLQKDTNKKIS